MIKITVESSAEQFRLATVTASKRKCQGSCKMCKGSISIVWHFQESLPPPLLVIYTDILFSHKSCLAARIASRGRVKAVAK